MVGIAASRLSAQGIGEARPLASDNDENGRSRNRRVEVHCK
jgi:outer membrane protein OmpA-like peptidoglycan-associated protein